MVTPAEWDLALKRLRYLADRSERRGYVPFGEEFVRSRRLGLLLGESGGRSGDVRLKLYMSLTMLAVGRDHSVKNTPGSSWAEALALPDPLGKGTRRITAALNRLADEGFIELTKTPGKPHHVRLLDPMGTNRPYSRPNRGGRRYVRVPLDVWTNGWIVALSGRALATVVVIQDRLGTKRQNCWIAPEDRSSAIGLSDATWTRAIRELSDHGHGIVEVHRQPLGTADNFDWTRLRNTYSIRRATLLDEPEERDRYRVTARQRPQPT